MAYRHPAHQAPALRPYRAPWTEQEHGTAYHMLTKLKAAFDPNGVMNRGTIFPLDS
ncbi:FAD-linked oxidase C-terminal domain-containing protein [Streptomyces sp. NPDC047117]|uniref:FAD-linked oxidase C-terminal domain-containing protein n=1 Tax=unclassified Streptomyces TaxID=2593676 RepID=UPI0034039C13